MDKSIQSILDNDYLILKTIPGDAYIIKVSPIEYYILFNGKISALMKI